VSRNFATYKAIIAAWKAKDVEGVLALMHDDIVWHFAVAAEPPVVGKAGARKFTQRFGASMAEVRWRVFDYAESGDRLFVEGVDEFTTTDGKRVAAPYAGVLEFRDGLVIGWRDYVDVGVMAAQQAGAPISKQVAALIDRPAI
jgi:ketosteroid isomerase-like protein